MSFSEPTRFVSAHGRRAWAGGYCNSGMEVWAGALQIASDVLPEFRRESDETAIQGTRIVSRIESDPSHVSRFYIGPGFSVEEQVWASSNQPAVLFRYRVRGTLRVQVILKFHPSLNLMWPAAIGGQTVSWDASASAYRLGEPSERFAALVSVPGATGHDQPINSAHDLGMRDELSVALDPKNPEALFVRLRAAHAPSAGGVEAKDVQKLGSEIWEDESMQREREVLSSGVHIGTPDDDVNRALAWAAITLDQDWVCNAELGCAYVAGFGPSRPGRRPQYAWYFAGDGLIAMHAALTRGELGRARDELRFIAKYQDEQSGMIWHELTQSAPYLDWKGAFPYMFVHADVTYPYISAVADYIRRSNDRDFLTEIWPSIEKAFAYGRSLVAEDGLPRIPAGKLGSDEQQPHSDELGLSASWVLACTDYAHLADMMGKTRSAEAAQEWAKEARNSFAKRYWNAKEKTPIQAYLENNVPVPDRGIGAIGAINENLFANAEVEHFLGEIASWRFQSDWGTRGIAVDDPTYNPSAYAHGSVWALATSEVARAFWATHKPAIAWEIWRRLVPWSDLDSPGHMHEVLDGDLYQPQEESVPEQTWSSAAFLSSALTGLFGLQIDAENNTITLTPHLPPEWNHAALDGVRIRDHQVKFTFQQSSDEFKVHVENEGGQVELRLSPEIPLGAHLQNSTACGRRISAHLVPHDEDEHADLNLMLPQGTCDVSVRYRGGITVSVPPYQPSLGDSSTGANLTSLALGKNALRVGMDIFPSVDNKLWVYTQRPVLRANVGNVKKVSAGIYEFDIPPTKEGSAYKHLDALLELGGQ